jgi:pyruvate/2-oxoglutarate dehydrogenase complex dihydrolipoamide dehydrogenase (E3) component
MSRVDRARLLGEPIGFVKLVTAGRRAVGRLGGGEVVGAHIVGPRAGELLHEVVLAMQSRAFAGRMAQAIHAYPTTSMAVQQAASQLFPIGRALVEGESLPVQSTTGG